MFSVFIKVDSAVDVCQICMQLLSCWHTELS